MPHPIRLGDATSHGGHVVSTASQDLVMGKPFAVIGDKCSCPLHGDGTIVEGDPHWTINDISIALHGHQVSCGAKLIASIENFDRQE